MNAKQNSETAGIHLLIDGHVQGVGFRYYVYDFAQAKGLTGWVRNCYSGQVEVLAQGPRADLDALLTHVQTGPSVAKVTDVQVEWRTADGRYDRFSLLATE